MSLEDITWAMREAPTDGPLERLILIYLANETAVDGSITSDLSYIPELCGVSQESVDRAVKRMERRGLVAYLGHPARLYLRAMEPPTPAGRPAKATISPEDRAWVLARWGEKCLRCGVRDDITLDHVIPESLGGPTARENLQPLCRSCNSAKGTKEVDYR